MKTLQTFFLCAPFFGLVAAVALPGCSSESAAESTAAPEEILCDKLAECGRLSEGMTVQQCAASVGEAHDALVEEPHACTPIIESAQRLAVCAMQQEDCKSDIGMEGEDLPEDHPCFEENERYKKALQEAGGQSQDPDAAVGCLFAYMMVMNMATSPATGEACTAHAECPDIECPDQLLGSDGYCQTGRCKTADDFCG